MPAHLRYEHKYIVPDQLLDRLRRFIEPYVRLDDHASAAAPFYTVRNIYFDDTRFRRYFEKDDGIEVRAKPRIRGYNDYHPAAMAFLEVKRRNGAVGSKDRAVLPFENIAELFVTGDVDRLVTPPSWMPDSRAAARKFLFHIHRDNLRPMLLECYEREPYVGTIEPSLRITFDRNIRSAMYPRLADLFSAEGTHQSFRKSFVLEVKHDATFGFPAWLRRFISEHTLIREALSKYWTCMTDWGAVHSHTHTRSHACSEWITTATSRNRIAHV